MNTTFYLFLAPSAFLFEKFKQIHLEWSIAKAAVTEHNSQWLNLSYCSYNIFIYIICKASYKVTIVNVIYFLVVNLKTAQRKRKLNLSRSR